MSQRKMSVAELAITIGISQEELKLKIEGDREWLYKEALATMKYLGFYEIREVFPEYYNEALKFDFCTKASA